jgi:hypothetical protein
VVASFERRSSFFSGISLGRYYRPLTGAETGLFFPTVATNFLSFDANINETFGD